MASFVNFSNHPSSLWDEAQIRESERYGEIRDIPFPMVSPSLDEQGVAEIAEEYVKRILAEDPAAVMCQGEFTLCFEVVQKLRNRNIPVLAACSERRTISEGNTKLSEFTFVRYRRYFQE